MNALRLFALGSVFVCLLSQATGPTKACLDGLTSISGTEFGWRRAFTNSLPSDKAFATSKKREKNIKDSMDLMKIELEDSDTPPMIVVPTAGTKIEFTKDWEEYGPMHARVLGGSDGVLRATVLLPVSAHTGMDNAKKWSKTDTYSLNYVDASGKESTLIKDAKSLDLITAQEVEIPLVEGKAIRLLYYRSGSGGPGGYSGGRDLYLTWEKGKPLGKPTDFTEMFWR
jgi:hypothetical protein